MKYENMYYTYKKGIHAIHGYEIGNNECEILFESPLFGDLIIFLISEKMCIYVSNERGREKVSYQTNQQKWNTDMINYLIESVERGIVEFYALHNLLDAFFLIDNHIDIIIIDNDTDNELYRGSPLGALDLLLRDRPICEFHKLEDIKCWDCQRVMVNCDDQATKEHICIYVKME